MLDKRAQTDRLMKFYAETSVQPAEVNPILEKHNSSPIRQSDKLAKIYSRPNITYNSIAQLSSLAAFIGTEQISNAAIEQAEVQIKYAGYIAKEKLNADKLQRLENVPIPSTFNYDALASLSHEAKEKLNNIRPTTIAQAQRISGIKPSDISVLLVQLGR